MSETCECSCCCGAVAPAGPAALLAPGIRQALFRYSSVNFVSVVDDPTRRCMIVTYKLITGEYSAFDIPWQWFHDEEYGRILDRCTKDLR